MPGHVHRPRSPRGLCERHRGDEARAAGVRTSRRRASARPTGGRGRRDGGRDPRRDRPETGRCDRQLRERLPATDRRHRRRLRIGRRLPARTRARDHAAGSAPAGRRPGRDRPRGAWHGRRGDRRRAGRLRRAWVAAAVLAVCATPIGNLDDVTLRVLSELAEADLLLCEDTRHTRRLLDRHGIRARLRSYHEHNEAARTAEVLPRLEAGERIALVSDAGLPGISDPGARLIGAALEARVPVTVLPGPSSVETALVASGLVGERYQFVGYLPRGEKALAELWEELSRWQWPVVAFDSPQRLPRTLRSLAA